ncbi:MAG: putative quorum-sensing-regulated virulence factor [Marinomonas sp.]
MGQWLQLALEIKINGLEKLVDPLRKPAEKKPNEPKVRIRFDD